MYKKFSFKMNKEYTIIIKESSGACLCQDCMIGKLGGNGTNAQIIDRKYDAEKCRVTYIVKSNRDFTKTFRTEAYIINENIKYTWIKMKG